jgi:hypothetical protein
MILSPDIEKFLFVFDPTLNMRHARLYLLAGAGDGRMGLNYTAAKKPGFFTFRFEPGWYVSNIVSSF